MEGMISKIVQKKLKRNPTGNSPRNLKKNAFCCLTVIQIFWVFTNREHLYILNKAAGQQKIARFLEQNVLENLQ